MQANHRAKLDVASEEALPRNGQYGNAQPFATGNTVTNGGSATHSAPGTVGKAGVIWKGIPYVQRPHQATDTNHAPRLWMEAIMGHGKGACDNVIPANEEPAAAPTAHAMGQTGTSAPGNLGGVRQVNANQFRHT